MFWSLRRETRVLSASPFVEERGSCPLRSWEEAVLDRFPESSGTRIVWTDLSSTVLRVRL